MEKPFLWVYEPNTTFCVQMNCDGVEKWWDNVQKQTGFNCGEKLSKKMGRWKLEQKKNNGNTFDQIRLLKDPKYTGDLLNPYVIEFHRRSRDREGWISLVATWCKRLPEIVVSC